jgi:hypothetical protein
MVWSAADQHSLVVGFLKLKHESKPIKSKQSLWWVVIKQQPKTNNQTLDHGISERGIRVL